MRDWAALQAARGLNPSPANIDRVASEFGAEAARWAFTQWELRRRARDKFERADTMLFDRDGLEMATHERVASFHASRFPSGAPVTDLTCGLGADLIAIGRRGPAVGYEADAERADLARFNLGAAEVEAVVHPMPFPPEVSGFLFADPARREGGRRRSFDPSAYEPPVDFLTGLCLGAPGAVLKLSPLLPDRFLRELGAQIAFVSFGRECREALALFGECRAGDDPVLAYHVESESWLCPGAEPDVVGEADAWLFEMDPAAIRCHAGDVFGAAALGDSNGYLTGAVRIDSPWLRAYRVLYSGKADLRETRRALEGLGAGPPVVKSRAPGVDPASLRLELKAKGDRQVIVAVWPYGRSLRHTVLEPA